MFEHVATFVACGALLVVAGSFLARAADAIAERTRLGKVWVGTVLLAAATSLPELTTDVAAVRIGAVDLAAGDLFGSCMANMLILALIDMLLPRRKVLKHASGGHSLSASLAMGLVALATFFVILRRDATVLGLSVESILLLLVFLGGSFAVYRDAQPGAGPAVAAPEGTWSLRRAVVTFAAGTAAVFSVAPLFARSAEGLAEATGLGTTFVGTLLVGLSTSLPELVASISAVRIGSYDLAVGNLFGSNAFNMAVFVALDVAHPGGSIFAALSPDHALSALASILLMAVGLSAIVYRARLRFALVEPSSALMLAVYALTVGVLYLRSTTPG